MLSECRTRAATDYSDGARRRTANVRDRYSYIFAGDETPIIARPLAST